LADVVALVRRITLNNMVREARNASSLEALRDAIERLSAECDAHERNNISQA